MPLVKVAILHDEIANLEVDFPQLAAFVGVRHLPFAANHDHEVDAVGAVHSPARFSGRHVVTRPEVELGHKGSKVRRLVARLRGKRHDVDSDGAFWTEEAFLLILAEHLLGCEGQVRELVKPPNIGWETSHDRFGQITRLHYDARLAFGSHNSSHLHFVVSFES